MNGKVARLGIIAAVAVGSGTAALATASGASPNALHQVIHANVSFAVTRLHAGIPATGAPVKGDTVAVTGAISRQGHRIGRTDIGCTFTDATTELCYAVDRIVGGSIVHVGAGSISKPGIDAITGGLGRFQGATGTVTTNFTGPGVGTLVYDIRLGH